MGLNPTALVARLRGALTADWVLDEARGGRQRHLASIAAYKRWSRAWPGFRSWWSSVTRGLLSRR
jgi:hypothetical protein